jgi:hypothetical protein
MEAPFEHIAFCRKWGTYSSYVQLGQIWLKIKENQPTPPQALNLTHKFF